MKLPSTGQVVREAGHTLLSAQHGRARIVLWTAGAAVGAAAVGFAWLADEAQGLLRRVLAVSPWWPWLLSPLGFALIAWLTRRFFRGAEGSGIPQTISAQLPDTQHLNASLFRPRLAIGRVLLAAAGLFCGGSIGREGPTVHVGAVIAHAFARFMPHGSTIAQQRVLILAGGAAGVSAAFNTPLAGIVFAVEELSRSFEERASGAALTAVILAGIISIAWIGDYTYFGHPVVAHVPGALAPAVLSVAIISGLGGGLFSRLMLLSSSGLPWVFGRLQRGRPVLFALLCGLIAAAVRTLSGGLTYGTGYRRRARCSWEMSTCRGSTRRPVPWRRSRPH